jgi:hypothetical protein
VPAPESGLHSRGLEVGERLLEQQNFRLDQRRFPVW